MTQATPASFADLYDSIYLDGGFTVSLDQSPTDTGYSVSVTSDQFALPTVVDGRILPFPAFRRAFGQIMERYPQASAVGGWVCPQGHVHLDPVEIIADLPTALTRAAGLGQEAIFDLSSRTEITVEEGAADRTPRPD